MPPAAVLMQMSNVLIPRALYVAVKLGIADRLVDGPLTVDELAGRP